MAYYHGNWRLDRSKAYVIYPNFVYYLQLTQPILPNLALT